MVGVIIDGTPPGIKIDVEIINQDLIKRRPGQSNITTDRDEPDKLIIETGIMNGLTTGEPITAFVRNKDIDSSYYEEIKYTPRPGHADYPATIKYKGMNDYRGGGRFSGRMTIGLVIAGSIAQQILMQKKIKIIAYTKEIGGIQDSNVNLNISKKYIYSQANLVRVADPNILESMVSKIREIKDQGDSVGGIIECIIEGLPVGVGEPWFDSIEAIISHMIFSIPAVKGIEFGNGFRAAKLLGSENNDPYFYDDNGEIKTARNNSGGILGGLSNGMPIIFRVAVKPTSSIAKTQQTVNITTHKETILKIRGRHDPCIVPRAVPVIENAAACTILDLMMVGGFL